MRRMLHGALLAVVSVGLLAGCGEDDPPEPAPPASPTGTATSPSETASPTGGSSPTVEPASGRQETFGSLTMSFPKGYDVRELSNMALAASGPDGEHVALMAVPTVNQDRLDALARDALGDATYVRKPVRLDDVEVDGVRMYHVSGPVGAGQTRDMLGVEHGGFEMGLQLITVLPRAARQELLESVLASITWS